MRTCRALKSAGLSFGEPKQGEKAGADEHCQWSKADFEALKQAIRTTVPEGVRMHMALQHIDPLDPDRALDSDRAIEKADFEALKQEIRTTVSDEGGEALQSIDLMDPDRALDSDHDIEAAWKRRRSPPTAEFEEARSKVWKEIGCAADGAPFVVAALVEQLRGFGNVFPSEFANDSPHPAQIAAAFLRDDCAGASWISASTRAKLTELAKHAPAVAATPAAAKP
ncbi:MAG: hypothetical protein ABSC06_17975 [Rhodopila sp.]|jgi:hypothetical protein